MPSFLPVSLSNQGSFPPPALPGFLGTPSPSATLPARPAPRGGPGWSVLSTGRASRVAAIPLFHACRRHYPGEINRCSRRSLPGRCQPSPYERRVGSRIIRFEACSAFTRVAARMVAESPLATLFPSKCFRPCRYLHNPLRLLPAGATVAGRGSHPLGNGAFPRRTLISVLENTYCRYSTQRVSLSIGGIRIHSSCQKLLTDNSRLGNFVELSNIGIDRQYRARAVRCTT